MNRLSLLRAVEFAAKAITGKASLPVLECVHLKGDGERLTVTGYNLDLYARMEVESDLVIDCCAPAGRLKTLLTNFTGEDVTVTETSISGPQKAPLQTQAGTEFPEIPEVTGKRFPIPGEAISKVIMAASTESQRYLLQSVFLDPKGYCVGTDGRRAHFVKIDTCKEPVILPVGAAKLLADAEGEMRVRFEKDRTRGAFSATGEGWEIGGKLIEGEFPKWNTSLPDAKGVPVTKDLIAAIERAMACAGPATAPWIEVHPDVIKATDYESEPMQTGIAEPFKASPQFLVEAMKAAGDKATLSGGGISPVVVSNGTFKAVIMPMRL